MSYLSEKQILDESVNLIDSRVFHRDFAKLPILNPVAGQDITFTRSTSATRVNQSGLIENVNIDVPRFDYDPATRVCRGLLIEEARTNLILRSEEFNDASWDKNSGAIVTANTTISPDGTQDADTLDQPTNLNNYAFQEIASGLTSTPYTFSIFVKQGTRVDFGFQLDDNGFSGDRYSLVYTFSNGNISTGGSGAARITSTGAVNYNNGWIRLYMSFTTRSSTVGNIIPMVGRASNGAGNGTTFIYGAQLEAGAFPTSYIPTTSATVTRAADSASVTGTNFSSWYNRNGGTILVEWSQPTISSQISQVQISDGTFNNRFGIINNSIGQHGLRLGSGGSSILSAAGGAIQANTTLRATFGAALNQQTIALLNGNGIASTANVTLMPTVNRLTIAANPDGGGNSSITLSKIGYFNRLLSARTQRILTLP